MTKFSELPFEARMGRMGDEAELVFETVYPHGWVRWGLRRPPIKVGALPLFVRAAPDYLTSDGFYDAMGVGQDQTLKLKVEKYTALLQWQREMPTNLFVWDSHNKRYAYIPLQDVTTQMGIAKLGKFPEGTPFWGFNLKKFRAEWIDHTNT